MQNTLHIRIEERKNEKKLDKTSIKCYKNNVLIKFL